MATDASQNEPPRLVQPVSTPQHFVPPGFRELRSQAVQRLQIGLFGLAAMLLLVGLANIVMERARMADADQAAPVTAGTAQQDDAASDPLADIGVVPNADPSATVSGKRH